MNDARSHPMLRTAIAGCLVTLAFVLLSASASAHEHVTSGDLEFIIGWDTEPAVVGSQNSIDIAVERHLANNTTEMVAGVANNLTVTVFTGPASVVKAVEPAFGRDGWYAFAIIPTREGVYTIRVTGTVEGTTFNVSSQPEEAIPAADVAFPVADPTPADLQNNATEQQRLIETLEAQVANFTTSGSAAQIDQLKKDNAALKSDLGTALLVGALGIVFGLAGTGIAVVGMRKGRGNT